MITVKAVNNIGRNKIGSIKGELYFVPVVDGTTYSHCAETEDIAMLLGLQIKYQGLNSQFVTFACRMLEIDSNWAK